MRAFFLLPSLFLAVSAFAQASTNTNSPDMAARRRQDYASGKWQARQDSLEQVFYKKPPYVQVSYYKNLRQLPWSAAMHLYVEKGHEKLVLFPNNGNQFLLPPLNSDSIMLGVEYRKRKIAFSKLPARYFTHGATIAFGRVNRTHFRAEPEEEVLREAFRTIDVVRWYPNKRIRGFYYLIITPRVYGDGAVITFYAPLLRNE